MPDYVYETTVEIACWKRHNCVACGCVYQYRQVTEAKGIADARSFSGAQAEKNGLVKLEGEMEPHPCPQCGVYQPNMIARPRLSGHNWMFIAVLVGILPAALIALLGAVPSHLIGIGGGILAGLVAACQIAIAWRNPNANLLANRAQAQDEIQAGVVQIVQLSEAGTHEPPPVRPRFAFGLILVALAGPALVAPVLAALALDLPYHREFQPHYVAAGDRMIVTFPRENLSSINGLWKGKASAELIDTNNVSTPLKAVAGQERYGHNIRSSRATSLCELYSYVYLPSDAVANGEIVRVRLSMDVAYPAPSSKGSRFYDERVTTVTRDLDVQLADRNHLRAYYGLWVLALVAGWGGIVVGSGVLVFQSWRECSQTEGAIVIPVKEDE